MTIEHFSITVDDMERSRAFYTAALAPLGLKPTLGDGKNWQMFGTKAHSEFGISPGKPTSAIHFAFRARSRSAVDKFHEQALKAGGKDHGKPGLRDYSKNYYAAFVIDPNGHNLEAVCFAAPKKKGKRS